MNTKTLVPQNAFLMPVSMNEAMQLVKMISNSTFIPNTYRGNEGDVLAAILMGASVNLTPIRALQNIAVINGRPCLWGDTPLAIVKSHPEFEYIVEEDDQKTATCRLKRKGQPECVRTFSENDAIKAGLANKVGPWKQYPKRMRQLRARSFALRDTFPDALCGIQSAEEVSDYQIEEKIPDESRIKPLSGVAGIKEKLIGKASATPPPETAHVIEATETPINASENEKGNDRQSVIAQAVDFETVQEKMQQARSSEELQAAVELAAQLSEAEKPAARALYKQQQETLTAATATKNGEQTNG